MSDKPKIIIDEDWKQQVQAEKEAADRKQQEPKKQAQPAGRQIPKPSLPLLFNTFATQAMIALGEIPNPITKKTETRLDEARHFIDTLGLLEEKTEGHRTPEESAMLREMLYQLRLGYVNAQNPPAEAEAEGESSQDEPHIVEGA